MKLKITVHPQIGESECACKEFGLLVNNTYGKIDQTKESIKYLKILCALDGMTNNVYCNRDEEIPSILYAEIRNKSDIYFSDVDIEYSIIRKDKDWKGDTILGKGVVRIGELSSWVGQMFKAEAEFGRADNIIIHRIWFKTENYIGKYENGHIDLADEKRCDKEKLNISFEMNQPCSSGVVTTK